MVSVLNLLIAVSLIVCAASAGGIIIDENIVSTGGVISFDETEVHDGEDLAVFGANKGFKQRSAGASQYVTGPGVSKYISTAEIGNGIASSSELHHTGVGATWDTLAVSSLIPNESELSCVGDRLAIASEMVATGRTPDHVEVSAMVGSQGTGGDYTVDKLVNTDTYSLSSDFYGRGMYHTDISIEREIGFDKDSDTMQHTDHVRRHKLGSSNLSGIISGYTDYTIGLVDFDDPYNLLTEVTNSSGNISVSVNQTE